jgi:hypothetical protein
MATEHKEPKTTKEARSNWAVEVFRGTLYEMQTKIMDFLSSDQVKDSASAKITTDTFQGVAYTYVIYKA